jgi:hypothetical protein
MNRPRLLIEEWLPTAELGIESVRERTPLTPFPAPNRLHVWWARRPLVACRAAILGSLLPADADREKFMHVLGIHGDPLAARARCNRGGDPATGERGWARVLRLRPSFHLQARPTDEISGYAEAAERLGPSPISCSTRRLVVAAYPLRRSGSGCQNRATT